MSDVAPLTDAEFELFRKLMYRTAGINLTSVKKPLVAGRLCNRVKHYGLSDYGAYFELVKNNTSGEFQAAIDLLTTNETFFFREPKHFEFVREQILPLWRSGPRRIWSAACSSGEEAYTLAMLLAEHAPTNAWDILGTDISTRVLATARSGQYPMQRAQDIPQRYLKRYCLKGVGSQEGTFVIGSELKAKVSFKQANLTENLLQLGNFDIIFLRNVMIYFDLETKCQVIEKLVEQIKPGGHLIIGHSESLHGISKAFRTIVPSIYQKL